MELRLTREALRLLERRERFVRATVVDATGSVPGKVGARMILREDGTTLGTIGGAALEERVRALAVEAFTLRRGGLHRFDLQKWKAGGLASLCGGTVHIAVEYVEARPNLLLWGGGHVARSLAEILPTLEYDFSVADDRPDWVSADRFPQADRRATTTPERLFDEFDPKQFTHLYILGYDAAKDLDVLDRALKVFPGTIGLISSAAKREHMFQELRNRGSTRAELARVQAPVGLPIGAESPSEIAVSIVAEIVRSIHPDRVARSRPAGAARRKRRTGDD